MADKDKSESKAHSAPPLASSKLEGEKNSPPSPSQFHSGPYDHLTDALPDLVSYEKVWILLGPTGEPLSIQRDMPAYGVSAIRGRVNDLYDNKTHHLTTETGAELTNSMSPHPEFRLPPAEPPPVESFGKKHDDNAKADNKK